MKSLRQNTTSPALVVARLSVRILGRDPGVEPESGSWKSEDGRQKSEARSGERGVESAAGETGATRQQQEWRRGMKRSAFEISMRPALTLPLSPGEREQLASALNG